MMALKTSLQPAFWQRHIEAYKASGLSRAAYCRQHGLKAHQLDYRLAKAKEVGEQEDNPFARVKLAPAATSSAESSPSRLRLCFSSGVTMELSADTSPAWIAELVARVGGQP